MERKTGRFKDVWLLFLFFVLSNFLAEGLVLLSGRWGIVIPADQRFYWVSLLASLMFFASMVIFFTVRRIPLADLGLGRPADWEKVVEYGLKAGAGAYFSAFFLGAVALGIAALLGFNPYLQPAVEVLQTTKTPLYQAILLLVILGFAPINEEILFRGMLYRRLEERFGSKALGISAALFALFHFDPLRFLPLMGAGAFFAWAYQRSGSLYAAWIAHGLMNSLMVFSM